MGNDCAKQFAGQTVIVTGGSIGYGLGTVRAMAAAGAKVYATARGRERLEAALADIEGAVPVTADVNSVEDWQRLVEQVLSDTGRIDVLVNNAGAGIKIAPLTEQSVADIDASLGTNLRGPILGCQAVIPAMVAAGQGTLINVLSICARQAWGGFSIYSAAKGGLEMFTRCLHSELQSKGVRVTSLIPSWGATDFAAAVGKEPWSDEMRAKVTQPDEFGQIVADICAIPRHLSVLDLTVLPLVQEFNPL